MRQPYKDKFLNDVDGDGCPIPYVTPFAAINIGRTPDLTTAQALLADRKCLSCPPTEQCSEPRCVLFGTKKASVGSGCMCDPKNPEGWGEVDGVKLPPITWAEEAREIVRQADTNMLANSHIDGITRLSDRYAPDAFFGWKR